ncbi:helix-turn-helix domain-containing protein [Niabella insulamsoli]|uniref:helix-turn-helix domain-containing protein n=1 Tax=Niabella insulamsoli TaxID=3144874 RepID=UPI0031FCC8C5
MKLFDISALKGQRLEWADSMPNRYKGIVLPQASLHVVQGGFGNMVFQKIQRPKYALWFSNYEINKRIQTHSRAEIPFIELSLLLQSNISYSSSAGKIRHRQWQFNLINALSMDNRALFEKDCYYTTLDIHLERSYLYALFELFPDLLGPFIAAVESKKEVYLFDKHIYATLQMLQTTELITFLISQPQINAILLDQCVTLLLGFAVSCKIEMASSHFRYDKKQELERRLQAVLSHLLSDLRTFKGVRNYARTAGMSETYLKQHFKQHFKKTLRETWNKERLSRCFMEVVSTTKTFEEIAFDYGFSDSSAFYKSFKRYYQFPPNFYRKTVGPE